MLSVVKVYGMFWNIWFSKNYFGDLKFLVAIFSSRCRNIDCFTSNYTIAHPYKNWLRYNILSRMYSHRAWFVHCGAILFNSLVNSFDRFNSHAWSMYSLQYLLMWINHLTYANQLIFVAIIARVNIDIASSACVSLHAVFKYH